MANVTETNVELEADGKPIFAAMDLISGKIKTIQGDIAKILDAANKGTDGIDRKLSNKVSELQAALGQMRSLSKFAEDAGKGKGPIVAINAEKAFGNATLKAAEFKRTVGQSSTAIDALNARLNKAVQAAANFGKMGVSSGPNFDKIERQRKSLTETLEVYKKLSAAQESLNRKAERTKGVDSSVQFKAEREKLAAAKLALEEKILNPRTRNFSAETAAALDAAKKYELSLDAVRDKKSAILKLEREQRQAERDRVKSLSDYDKAMLQAEKVKKSQMDAMWANKKAEDDRARAQLDAANLKLKLAEIAANKARSVDVQFQKTQVKSQTAGILAGGNGEAARLDLIQRVLKAKKDFENAEVEDKKHMLELLKLEQSRLGELVRQTKQAEALRRASDTTSIQYQRSQLGPQMSSKLSSLGVEGARADQLRQVEAAHSRYLAAQDKDRKGMLDILKLEQARLAELEKQIKAKAKADQPPTSHSILPSGGFGTVIARTAAYVAAGSGIFAVVGALQQGFSFALEFEDALVKLQAVAGATDGQMTKLTESIIEVGRQSRFSLSDLSEAATGLAQAGFSVADIESSLKSVQTLAAASGSTLSQAVDLTTSAISAFSLSTDNASRIADGMVSALNRSKLTVSDVASAIQTVGSTAAASNITLQELTGTIGAMTQSGVRGQMASTGLRQFIIDLTNPSKDLSEQLTKLGLTFEDVDISTRGLPAVLQTLASSGFGASEAFGSLENRSAAAYLTLRKQIPMIDELINAQNDVGVATAAAAKATASFDAQWQMFKTNLGASAFSLVELMGLDEAITKINELSERARFLDEYKRNNATGGEPSTSIPTPRTVAVGGSIAFQAGKQAFDYILGGAGGSAAADNYIKSKHALDAYNEALDATQTKVNETNDKLANHNQTMTALQAAIARVTARQSDLKDGSPALATETASMSAQFQGLAKYLDNSKDSFGGLINAMQMYRQEAGLAGSAMAAQVAQAARAQAALSGAQAQNTLAEIRRRFKGISPEDQQLLDQALAGDAKARLKVMGQNPNRSAAFQNALNIYGQQLVTRDNGTAMERTATVDAAAKLIPVDDTRMRARTNEIDTLTNAQKDKARLKVILAEIDRDLITYKANEAMVRALQTQRYTLEPKLTSPGGFKTDTAGAASAARSADRKATDSAAMKRLLEDPRIGARVTATKDDHNKYVAGTNRISDHYMDKAIDFVPKGGMGSMTKDQVRKMIENLGVKIRTNGQGVEQLFGPGDKGHNNHWHVAWEGSAPSGDALDKADTANSQAALNAADMKLKFGLKERKKATSTFVFDELSKASEADFANWEAAYRKLNDDQSRNFTPSQKDDRLLTVEETIREKREEFQTKTVEDLAAMVERSFEAITRIFEEELRPFDMAIAKLQGQSQGFELASNQGLVPDYVKTLNSQKLGRVTEQRQQARLSQLPNEINQKRASIKTLTEANSSGYLEGSALEKHTADVAKLTAELSKLEQERAQLEQVFGAKGLIPATFSQGFDQAIASIKGASDFGMTFSQMMTMNIGGALEQTRQSFGTFFSDILTGSQTVLGAFGNFTKSIISMLEDMVAKALAMQLFNFLVGLVAPTAFGPSTGGITEGLRADFGVGGTGRATLPGFSEGGSVTQGTASRDSVLAKLQKGEFVMRRSAVDSVGTSFMENLNRNGSQSLKDMRSMPQLIAPQAKQEMKVFVVAPTAKPQMSPSDVLLILQDDMLKGGTTKQLVRHISQGG